MKEKKILQVCAIDATVDVLLLPLIEKSMKEGYEVHNVCTNTGKFTALQEQGLTMIDVSIDRKISPFKNVKSIWKLYKLMKKEKYDIVHVHTPIAALLGRIAAKMAGVKNIVYTAHGFYFHEEMSKFQYKLFYNIEKYAAKYMTDWLLLQSKEDYNLSVKDNFKVQDKIIHLSNGVDIWEKFNPDRISLEESLSLREELSIQEDGFTFLFVGRLVKEKGIFELIEAFKQVNEKHPSTKLILVGGLLDSERDHQSYQILTEELKHSNICYLGFRKDIPELMNLADTFILPSYREGLPRSIIEAMAMSKPIIATDIRGCREEVFHNENGFLIPKATVDSLKDAMNEMIENVSKTKRFGKRSREIVEELFDENKVLKKQMDLFYSILK